MRYIGIKNIKYEWDGEYLILKLPNIIRRYLPEHVGLTKSYIESHCYTDHSPAVKKLDNTPPLGTKHDSGKPRISLVPPEAILEMATALTYGASKYGTDNFKAGLSYRRLLDATMRHLLSFSAGEDIDAESGNSHVSHALASLAMLVYTIKNNPGFDDRYKKEGKS